MNWLAEIFTQQTFIQAILVLSLICAAGVALGSVKIYGISLGSTFVFFAGIIAGLRTYPVHLLSRRAGRTGLLRITEKRRRQTESACPHASGYRNTHDARHTLDNGHSAFRGHGTFLRGGHEHPYARSGPAGPPAGSSGRHGNSQQHGDGLCGRLPCRSYRSYIVRGNTARSVSNKNNTKTV